MMFLVKAIVVVYRLAVLSLVDYGAPLFCFFISNFNLLIDGVVASAIAIPIVRTCSF